MSTDRILALCAFFVAVVGLLSSLYDGYENRRHFRVSQAPSFLFDYGGGGETVIYSASNRGNGPAIIKWMSVFVDKKEVSSWEQMVKAVGWDGPQDYTFQVIWPETWIKSSDNEYRKIFISNNPALSKLIHSARYRIQISACACSLYEECSIVNLFTFPNAAEPLSCNRKSTFRLPETF